MIVNNKVVLGAQDGVIWNRRVCVGYVESVNLAKPKVKSSLGKVTEGQSSSRCDWWIVGKCAIVIMDWNFGNYKAEWKVRLDWHWR